MAVSAISLLAISYAAACGLIALFQIALIAGAPWGRITQGGQHEGPLPPRGRLLAALSIGVLAVMALSLTSVAGLWPYWPAWTGWLTLTIRALSALANCITPSLPERRLWAPITLTLLGIVIAVLSLAWIG